MGSKKPKTPKCQKCKGKLKKAATSWLTLVLWECESCDFSVYR